MYSMTTPSRLYSEHMAAAAELHSPELVELKYLRAEDLDPILEEERLAWRSLLNWDFAASAELVTRFVRMQALTGHALVVADKVVGYSYYVSEDHKGLIGDLFVSREYATHDNEDRLLGACLQGLVSPGRVTRIEAQLMMLRGPFERKLPFSKNVEVYPRNFMVADLSALDSLESHPLAPGFRIEPWDEMRHEEAATLIANTYRTHVDSSINDQYRSYPGARRFLTNIVQYPGCGSFLANASLIARNNEGRVCGIVLSSKVAQDVGHITQICVAPETQNRGFGYELLRRCLHLLRELGCERTSLTVTASNAGAIALYNRMYFRAVRRFAAYVWQGF